MKEERRTSWGGIELRAENRDGVRVIRGHAAVFEKYSQNLGGFVEKIAKGAFIESLNSKDIRAIWSHNVDLPLGRTSNKTLKLWEDDFGLAFELELPDTTLGRDGYTSIERGDVNAMSFGFSVIEDEWKRGESGKPHERTLRKIDLFEISPVVFPAYEQTQVSTRSAKRVEELEREWAKEENKNSELLKKQEELEAWRPKI